MNGSVVRKMLRLQPVWVVVVILLSGCTGNFTPRPRGFFRIDLPVKSYKLYESGCPFSFEYPQYAMVVKHNSPTSMPCWLNVEFPEFRGTLHLSYFDVPGQSGEQPPVMQYMEDSRKLAMKHTVKAQAIEEEPIKNPEQKVYGTIYDIEGLNTASSMQFYLTDSTKHFLRGALYFNVAPRNDSLSPVIGFIREDVTRFIASFQWKAGEAPYPRAGD